jgi:hypothetical protein
MWISYSKTTSNEPGTRNSLNFQLKTGFIVLLGDVENGSSHRIYVKKMGKSMANVAVVRRKYVVCAIASGMGPKTVPRMKRPTSSWKQRSKQDGNDVIVVEPWLS